MFRKRILANDRVSLLESAGPRKHVLMVVYRLLILATILYFIYSLSYQILYFKSCDRIIKESTKITFIEESQSEQTIKANKFNLNCRTIHLASVCAGFNSTRNFYILLKSILFHRTDKIHLHLMVDNESDIILKSLFSSWEVIDLEVTYYNASKYERQISWIPSTHYSNKFGLMKLIFPSILADETLLPAVIMIDTDMMVLGNIRDLQEKLEQIFKSGSPDSEDKMFAMVENQSDWYVGSNISLSSKVWPALGRGFNSGLIMVNLGQARIMPWQKIWSERAELDLINFLTAPLADQDIFNAIFKDKPELIEKLPCTLNLQLNGHTRFNESCPEYLETIAKGGFQIIHWNSPLKYQTKNAMSEFYQTRLVTFRNWNGQLLKSSPCFNDNLSSPAFRNSVTTVDSICRDMRPTSADRLRTHLYYLEYDYQVTENDITYVVHMSLDRLQVLDELASHWLGPISAAIYLSEQETEVFLDMIENSANLLRRRNIGYHIVYRDYGFNYPINRLRNIALDNTLTQNVVLSDIDLLPSYNLYDYLKKTISSMNHGNTSNQVLNKKALVIAAFENIQYKYEFPKNKEELLKQLNLGTVSIFRQELWPRGQAQTEYSKWKTATQPYSVQWRPDYEPFIVTSRDVARYDERFVGFGFNKVQHIMILASLYYDFIVLPDAFLIHKFHSPSYDIIRHRNNPAYKRCIKLLERQFLIELNNLRPEFFKELRLQQQQQQISTTTIG